MATTTKVLSAEYVQVLARLGYTFQLNQCTDRIECNGQPLSDSLESVIFSKLRDANYPNVKVARDAYIASAYHNSFHPVKDYLNSLRYDGGQHIARLATYFTNPDGNFGNWLRRWLIGAVRRVLKPGEQNRMLVIEGLQNIGKSKFVEWLAPEKLRENHFKTGPIYPDVKDHKIALMERWIWEVAELSSTTRRADRDALKTFISLERVTERSPYNRYELQKPALTSFVGTANNERGLLSDPTGNRRYMIAKISEIDWRGYTADINVDDIWAEAQMLWLAGEPADLTPDEYKLAEDINKTYEVEDSLEGILMQHFEIDSKQTTWWTPSWKILMELDNSESDPLTKQPSKPTYKAPSNVTSAQLAILMTTLGCERVKQRDPNNKNQGPIWGYKGVREL